MPGYILDNEENVVTKKANKYRITGVSFNFSSNNIRYQYEKISIDAEEEETIVGEERVFIDGEGYENFMTPNPDGTFSFKGNLEKKLYQDIETRTGRTGVIE